MATVINPDNGVFIVNGTISSTSLTPSTQVKLRISSTDDIDLNNIPVSFAAADVALNVAGGIYTAGNHYVDGTFVANGDIVSLGNAGGSLTLGANISSHILPSETDTYDIGDASKNWRKVYAEHLVLDNTTAIITTGFTDGNSTNVINSSTSASITLPDGTDGGIYIFYVDSSGPAAGTVTITPTTANGFSSMVFNNSGDSATLTYRATDGWTVLNAFRTSVNV